MKRGMLYTCARRQGYNVLAMGQHADDLAESFLMSAFHNGAWLRGGGKCMHAGHAAILNHLGFRGYKHQYTFKLSRLVVFVFVFVA